MPLSVDGCRIDVHELKARCCGRWPDIIASACEIHRQLLDGRHHPWPRCGLLQDLATLFNANPKGGAK